MIDAPALPSARPGWTRSHAAGRAHAEAVEICAPDRTATALLLGYAAPPFPAEVAPGFVWSVRLHPPESGTGWVLELFSLVQRRLKAARLPWANVLYDSRTYLIRSSTEVAQFAPAAETTRASSDLVSI
jgi:hypothetical protein